MKEKNESNKRKSKELYEETFSFMKVNLSKEVDSLVNKVNELQEEYEIGGTHQSGIVDM